MLRNGMLLIVFQSKLVKRKNLENVKVRIYIYLYYKRVCTAHTWVIPRRIQFSSHTQKE